MKTTIIPDSFLDQIPYKFTIVEKREILSEYITLLVRLGYDIKPLMGKSLAYYDFEKVQKAIKKLELELEEQ